MCGGPWRQQLRLVDAPGAASAETLADRIRDDARAILTKLDALEQEIGDLQRQGDELKAGDLSLDELHRRLAGIASAGVTGS